MELTRGRVLFGLLAALLALSYIVLSAVLTVVVFAVTVAYVLYPVRQELRQRGVSPRIASGVLTLGTCLAGLLFVVPFAYVIYLRQEDLASKFRQIPETVSYTVGGAEYVIEVQPIQEGLLSFVRDLAVTLLVAAPGIALGGILFILVFYGIMYRPSAVRQAVLGFTPAEYHDVLDRLHNRTRATLYSIYVIQALTAAATFVIAALLFGLLGYTSPVWLAVFAAILQFVPVLGPSLLIIVLALTDIFLLDMLVRGAAVLFFGLLFVSLVPDAVLRPKLAKRAGSLSPTLYFVGFVGGVLTVGAIGFIVGPLVIALLVEVVKLLSEHRVATPESS